METTFQLRLALRDKQLFERSARGSGMSLAAFLRQAGREKAARAGKRAACLDYRDEIALNPEAERDSKAFIRSRLWGHHALHS